MKFCVAAMKVDLHLPHSHALKERRSVVNSIKDRIRQRFNASVIEDGGSAWQAVTLVVAAAAHTESAVEQEFRQIQELILQETRASVMNLQIEYYV